MKTILLLLALLLAGTAQAQTSATDKQALASQLNKLMRDPEKPTQSVRFVFTGCHVQQIIRDNDADVHPSEAVAVSYSHNGNGAGVNLSEGVFELKFEFNWSDVAAVSCEKEAEGPYYQLRIKRGKKDGSSSTTTTTSTTLYTTNAATAHDLTRRLEAVRQSCQ